MNTQTVACSLPDAFLKQMKSLLGEADFFKYLNEMEKPPKKGLRMNPLKWQEHDQKGLLDLITGEQGENGCATVPGLRSVPWAPYGYYYEDPFRPGQSPLHEAGLYYIQEPSAMSAVALLDPQPGEAVLDLCAAPGGKSTQIAAEMAGQGVLVSNEPVLNRARVLSSNIERMGIRNCMVTSVFPDQLTEVFPSFFDKILVDAPCSGEGMFRKAPESRNEWNAGSPEQCAERQKQILKAAAFMLRPGGTLVYSTCTFNLKENEEVIEEFLGTNPDYHLVPFELPGLPAAEPGMLHLYPHEIEGEGHFLAKLIRDDMVQDQVYSGKQENKHFHQRKKIEMPAIPDVFRNMTFGKERLYLDNHRLWVLPQRITSEMFRTLRVLRSGLALCDLTGRMSEPDHASGMALSADEIKSVCELTWDEMTAYQAGETIRKNCPKGWVLLQYHGISLGWGKQTDGMIKNHYPKGLRRRGGIWQ